jgi:hypothetical protein
VIVAGWSGVESRERFGLQRFRADGSPDTTFGSGGSAPFSFGSYADQDIMTVAATPSGDVLVAGSTGDARLALARVEGSSRRPRRMAPVAAVEDVYRWSANVGDGARVVVRYGSPKGMDPGSFDDRDVYVIGPDGSRHDVTLAGSESFFDGRQMRVTYLLTPPGGSWDSADGAYTVHVRGGQVFDRSHASVAPGKIGGFKVDFPVFERTGA